MPALYDFECPECVRVESDVFVESDKRNTTYIYCGEGHEGTKMQRLFPTSQAIHSFEAYYDPALDCDIHGRREKKEIMAALNVQEAGDAIHGGRNAELSPNATVVDIQKETGRKLSDIQREQEHNHKMANNWNVSFEGSNEQVSSLDRLSNPSKAARKGETKTRTKRIKALPESE